jgi:hypothetical protein
MFEANGNGSGRCRFSLWPAFRRKIGFPWPCRHSGMAGKRLVPGAKSNFLMKEGSRVEEDEIEWIKLQISLFLNVSMTVISQRPC